MLYPVQGKKKWFYLWICLIFFCGGPSVLARNPWEIRINIPEYKLYLYRGDKLHCFYPIAVGRHDAPSPVGNFQVAEKVCNPTWYPPDSKKTPVPPGPDNPLGGFWMGLNIEGYGIHGNSAPWSIGRSISLGCFRMKNQDVEQLFQLIPVGTPVKITYKTVVCGIISDSDPWLELFPDIYGLENTNHELFCVVSEIYHLYPAHWKALQYLMTHSKRPCKIEIPREISVQGDFFGIDGFYWNRELYVSQRILKALHETDMPADEKPPISGYLEVSKIQSLKGLQIQWNSTANILKICHERQGLLNYFP